MKWMSRAFQRRWFHVGALVIAVLYGFGGIVHIGNILGFGEIKWTEAPLTWRVGDIWWGALDVAAVVGIVFKSPLGLIAIILAAGTQVAVYGFVPDAFAPTAAHHSTLRGLVYFNSAILLMLVVALYVANRSNSTKSPPDDT